MTKLEKAIFEMYGIQVDGDHILSPIGKIKPVLKKGNTKVGENVYTFSMLPTNEEYTVEINGTVYKVSGTCVCKCKGCYALTGHYRIRNTIRSMAINTILANQYTDFLKRAIMAQLEIIRSGEIRIHAAGDFNTVNPAEYTEMWHDICKNHETFLFWTYTKIRKYETLFDNLNNANIVKSIIPKIGFNYGHCDYILNTYYTLKEAGKKVYICKCGFDDSHHCEGCNVCSQYDYVLFLEHSTEYKGKEDPLYQKLYNVVMNQ